MAQTKEYVTSLHAEFDNKAFEQGVKQTSETLKQFNQSLEKMDGANAFNGISAAANKVNFSGAESALESLRDRFSFSGTFIGRIVENLADSVTGMVSRMTSSINQFTLAPINQGFAEYETKMGSIQTIMAGTGEDLATVNQYLEELNHYADRTIYSFSDMTQNIGKFTNSGVKLKDAVAAIQGVANEAALSGANAQQASHAMYNFAQALSAGYVKLIDWKSIENANMATMGFKEELLKTALELKTVKDVGNGMFETLTTDANGATSDAFNATKAFNDSLSHQWMTTEVLTKTLAKYADENTDLGKKAFAAAQDLKTFSQMIDTIKEAIGSGWAMAAQNIFGDFEEAKKLWTGINNAVSGPIEKFFEQLNGTDETVDGVTTHLYGLLDGWKDVVNETTGLSGRDSLIKGLANTFKFLGSVITPIKEALQEMFPPITYKNLTALSEKFLEFSEHLKLSNDAAKAIKSTVKLLLTPVKGMLIVLKDGIKVLGAFTKWCIKTDVAIAKFVLSSKLIKTVAKMFELLADRAREAWTRFKPFTSSAFKGFTNTVEKTAKFLEKAWDFTKPFTSAAFTGIVSTIGLLGKGIQNAVKYLEPIIANKFSVSLDSFKNFFSLIKLPTLESLGKAIGNVVTNVKEFAVSLQKVPLIREFSNAIEGLAKNFDNLVGHIKDGSALKDFQALIQSLKNDLSGGNLNLGTLFEKIKAFFSWEWMSDEQQINWESLNQGLQYQFSHIDFKPAVEGLFKNLQDTIKKHKFLSGISDAFSGFTGKEVQAAVGGGGGFFDGLLSIFGVNGSLGSLMPDPIKKSIENFGTAIGDLSKYLGVAEETLPLVQDIVTIFATIGVAKGFGKASNSLAELLTSFTGLFTGFTTLQKSVAKSFNATAFKTYVEAIVLLVGACVALAELSKYDFIDLKRDLIVFGIVLGLTTTTMATIGKIKVDYKEITAFAAFMLALSVSLYLLVGVIAIMNRMDPGSMAASAAAIVIFTSTLALAMKIAGGAMSAGGALGFLAMAGAMLLLVPALKSLAKLDTATLLKGGIAIAGLMFSLALAARYAGGLGGLGLAAMALSIGVLVPSLLILSKLDPSKLAKAGIAVSGLMMAIGLASRLASGGGGTFEILAIAAAINALIPPLLLMAILPWPMVLKSVAAVSTLMISLGLASKLAEGMRLSMLASFAGLMLIVAGSLLILSNYPWQGLLAASGSMSLLLISLGVCANLIKKASLDGKQVKPFLAFALVLVEIGAALWGVLKSGAKWEEMLGAAGAMSALLLSLGAVSTIIGKFGGADGKQVKSFLAFALVLIEIAAALWIVLGTGAKWEEMLGASAAMSLLLLSLTASLAILSTVHANVATAASAAAALIVFMGIIGGVFAVVGYLIETYMSASAKHKILKGIETIGDIFEKIGEVVGKLVGGVISGLEEAIGSGFGKMITDFITEAKPGMEDLANMDKLDAAKGAAALAAAIALIGAGEFIHNLLSLGGALDNKTGKDLAKFMESILPIMDSLAKYGKDGEAALLGVKAIAECLLALTVSELMEGIGRFFGIGGGDKYKEFEKGVKLLGRGIAAFSEEVAGRVNPEAVEPAINALKSLIEISGDIPTTGGLFGLIFGKHNLEEFGKGLKKLGHGLADFSSEVKGKIDEDAVQSATNAGKLLTALVSSIPSSDGIAQVIMGQKDMQKFTEGIMPFARAAVAMSKLLTENPINTKAVESAINMGKALTALEQNLPTTGGKFAEWLFGQKDMTKFTEQIMPFTRAIVAMSKLLEREPISATAVESAKMVCNALSQIAEDVPDTRSIINFFTGKGTLDSFASQMGKLAQGVKAFSDGVAGIDSAAVDVAIDTFNKIIAIATELQGVDTNILGTFGENMYSLGYAAVDQFILAFSEAGPELQTAVAGMTQAIEAELRQDRMQRISTGVITGLRNGLTVNTPMLINQAQNVANTMMKTIDSSIKNNLSTILSSVQTVCTRILATFRANLAGTRFETIGKNIDAGLARGIASGSSAVTRAAVAVARQAYLAAQHTLDIHSPSRVFAWLGEMSDEGFAKGFLDSGKDVAVAAETVAGNALTAATKAANDMSSALAMDVDATPVITPVLDLSEIQNGASDIDSIFGSMNPNMTFGLGSDLMSYITAMSSFGGNSAVIDAITAAANAANGAGVATTNVTVNVYGAPGQDVNTLAKAVEDRINTSIRRRSEVYNNA